MVHHNYPTLSLEILQKMPKVRLAGYCGKSHSWPNSFADENAEWNKKAGRV
jgi:hypothetical protein